MPSHQAALTTVLTSRRKFTGDFGGEGAPMEDGQVRKLPIFAVCMKQISGSQSFHIPPYKLKHCQFLPGKNSTVHIAWIWFQASFADLSQRY